MCAGLRARDVFASIRVSPTRAMGRSAKVLELLVVQVDLQCFEVLPDMIERERAGNGEHGGGAAEEPGKDDPRRGRALLCRDLSKRRRIVAPQGQVRHDHNPLLGAVADLTLLLAPRRVVAVW